MLLNPAQRCNALPTVTDLMANSYSDPLPRIQSGRVFGLSVISTTALLLCLAMAADSVADDDDGIAFFEARIRPVLVERCYECHNTADVSEGGLAVDSRAGIRAESQHGRVVVPREPAESLLLKVLRHEIPDLEMPENGPRLDKSVVDDFQRWIEMGAPDPRDDPPSAAELSEVTSWQQALETRKRWWSFQPIQNSNPPDAGTSAHPIDRFIQAKLEENHLPRAAKADRRTLIRRLSFALTGLPPNSQAVEQFVNDHTEGAYEKLVDEYLDSPHFGERWARHWMDLVRYADSHGSEGDPIIPHAYQYRDYLIRALNADVPYDQLVREHLAGDLLADPRINESLGINESAIGPAHFRFVFHGFAPTDALDEKVRFTDDQINVVSKAFLGLTVSCARCHDHKFDAISQTDYYAMFGIFASCRPALRDVNLESRQTTNVREIQQLKRKLRAELVTAWQASLSEATLGLLDPDEQLQRQMDSAKEPEQLLHFWKQLTVRDDGMPLEDAWTDARQAWREQRDARSQRQDTRRWDLTSRSDFAQWFAFGNGLRHQPSAAGEFAVNAEGPVLQGIFPAGVLTHGVSQRHRGFLASPRFHLDREYDAWLLVAGNGQPSIRYVVENYPRNGTVYPIPTIDRQHFYWVKLNLDYWTGDTIHFELATSKDAPLQNRNREQSWFAIRDVVVRPSGEQGPPSISLEYLTPLFEATDPAPRTKAELADRIQTTLARAIRRWGDGSITDSQALFLNACLPLLPNDLQTLSSAESTIRAIRQLEAEIPEPTRVPGVVEADAFDQPLYVRGNHRTPADPVRRRFLEAIDGIPYETNMSGRRELAESILDADNPLTSRVIANRIWHYLFGRGIVTTPDNFGQLGAKPSHPELLDYLATRIRATGWSLKQAIRFVVTSDTWQSSSASSVRADEIDPENRLLSHANVVRLDAEAIRDSLLSVSGQLDKSMYGDGFGANSSAKRRSVYVTSRRNSLDEFLKTFDSPTPFSTKGRRDSTNVPSQSLTMMNDPFVIQLASSWAESVSGSPRERIETMFRSALGRWPSTPEMNSSAEYVRSMQTEFKADEKRRAKLTHRVRETESAIAAIVGPAREKILVEQGSSSATAGLGPEPLAAWDFEDNLKDSVGSLDGKVFGNATVLDGALQLDGSGYVATAPLRRNLAEKTLEAWVQLATLDQGGGGVITVQTRNGVQFDSIVYAERQPRHWMAGSNGFARTEDLDGVAESEADKVAVHVAIAYDKDGTIRFYRNGTRYGRSTNKGSLQSFTAEESQVLFGLRHGQVGEEADGRRLRGRILAARLYDRALGDAEIAASAAGTAYISEQRLLAALTPDQRDALTHLRQQLAETESRLATLPQAHPPNEAWARLAHAIFNLKEFIYLK